MEDEKSGGGRRRNFPGKKIVPALCLACLPLLLLGAAAAFFFWYAILRHRPAKQKKEKHKGSQEKWAGEDMQTDEAARTGSDKGKGFDDFRGEIAAGVEWFKGMKPEQITLESYDGLKLTTHLLPAEQESRNVLLLMHGYRCDGYTDFSGLYQFYHEMGYHLIVPHQRCHGLSEGKYICFGVKERYDCKLWAEYAVKRFGKECNLYLSGISMGCSTVVMAAGLELPENVRGIIADCGFTSPYAIFRRVLKDEFHLPAFPLLKLTEILTWKKAGFKYKEVSTLDVVRKCRIPILFIHGGKDNFVPVQMTLDNYAACAGPKELLIVPDAAHATSSLTEPRLYRRTALAFMRKYEKR